MNKGDFFYRYIYKKDNGYQLSYMNEHYGWYENIEDALFDRDRLEQVDWDFELFVELPEIPNPYYHMTLPSYNHERRYITTIPERYVVQRRIDGKLITFGRYKSLDDAKKRRDELIANGWKQ